MGDNSVTVTYTEGVVTVEATVTIVGKAIPVANLFDKNDSDVVLNGRYNSSNAVVAYAEGQLVTGYIEGNVGDTFTLKSDKAQNANGYTGTLMAYDSNKNYVAKFVNAATATGGWAWASDNLSGTITLTGEYGSEPYNNVAFVRFCIAYTDIDSIVITKV